MQIETAGSAPNLGVREWKTDLEPNTIKQATKPWELVAAKSVQFQLPSVELCDFLPAEDPALSLNIDSLFGLVD